MIRRFQKFPGGSAITLIALVALCATAVAQTKVPGVAASEPSSQTEPKITPEDPAIGAPLIVDEAMKLKQRLRGLADRIPAETLLGDFDKQINDLRKAIEETSHETEAIIQSRATLAELQQSALDWQSLSKQDTDLADKLARQARIVEEERRLLRDDQTRWDRTNDRIKQDNASADLVEVTKQALSDIRTASSLADRQRDRIISLQKAAAAQGSIVSVEIENVSKAMTDSQRSLFEQDSQPLWRIQFKTETDEAVVRLLERPYAMNLTRFVNFVSTKLWSIVCIVVLTIAALALFIRMSRRTRGSIEKSTEPVYANDVFHRPGSLALLVGLAAVMPMLTEAPLGAKAIVDLLYMIPVFRLLMPRVSAPFRKMTVVLISSVFTWELIKFLRLSLWVKRDLLAVFCVVVAVLFCRMLLSIPRASVRTRGARTMIYAGYAGVFLIIVCFFANVFGYFGLSDLTGNGVLITAYRGVSFCTIFLVGISIIAFALNTSTSRRLSLVRTGGDKMARRLSAALALILLFAWLSTALSLFAVKDDVHRALSAALNYQIAVGTVTFAPSNIAVFVLTLFFGYVVASITRAILGEEILPRLNLARGVPNAIATCAHYLLLLLVFLFALAAAGVELSKFTILTGAFGVGVGFGLQNVVNNFSSGLILLLERPVRVGDSLEIGTMAGIVKSIGFRSSTLRSFDGADLIIPNGLLISQQVTNWTLSGTNRRVFLRFRVAYGNDPQHVRDLLLQTVEGHPDVLKDPIPTALFLGFGDTALEFEVWFWAPRSDIVPALKSQVSLRIAAALSDAGIQVPFPQRDLYVRNVDEPRREVFTPTGKDEGKREDKRSTANSHP